MAYPPDSHKRGGQGNRFRDVASADGRRPRRRKHEGNGHVEGEARHGEEFRDGGDGEGPPGEGDVRLVGRDLGEDAERAAEVKLKRRTRRKALVEATTAFIHGSKRAGPEPVFLWRLTVTKKMRNAASSRRAEAGVWPLILESE
jgi:hypothetical protein